MAAPAESQGSTSNGDPAPGATEGLVDRARLGLVHGTERARDAGERHVSVAVPFRAFDRNRGVAASVLAGGVAYRLFLWLLPFGLVVGGALGLGNADSTEEAVASGGLPAAFVDAIGDIARAADSNSWWLLLTGVPLLLYEGYAGAKSMELIHALIWREPPRPTRPLVGSLVFSGGLCAFVAAISLTWWFRDQTTLDQVLVAVLTFVPLTALWLVVSLHLPHGRASWTSLLPGSLLVAIAFLAGNALIVYWLGPKLDKSTSLYGVLGIVATILFFMYCAGRIVVTAPILNSALHEERLRHNPDAPAAAATAGASDDHGSGRQDLIPLTPDPGRRVRS